MQILTLGHYYHHSWICGSAKLINLPLWLDLLSPQTMFFMLFLTGMWRVKWTEWRLFLLSILLTEFDVRPVPGLGECLKEKKGPSFCQATRWGIKNAVRYYNLGNVQKPKIWARRGNWGHFWLRGHWASSNIPAPTELFQTMTTFNFFWSCQLFLRENIPACCFSGNSGLFAGMSSPQALSLPATLNLMLTKPSLFSQKENCLHHLFAFETMICFPCHFTQLSFQNLLRQLVSYSP